ncbi:hypothetical protein CTI12_AA594800 [Artemisia annua]|uniref:Uncharacterized protein n=1 Tax=Artemisia annua TaxID=35608 RepID=A0A2U1KJM0_ARTAN|nr:hypothetical protein CTI12_AA594800 [Artemisia annua]
MKPNDFVAISSAGRLRLRMFRKLFQKLRDIERDGREEVQSEQRKHAKQTAATDLISRLKPLNNHGSYFESDNQEVDTWLHRQNHGDNR